VSTSQQEWIKRRADAVRARYSAFSCLHENGHGETLVDEDTAVQMFCPFHGNVNTPAARYYPSSGHRTDYVRCFRCHENWDAINLYIKFKGVDFMTALRELERRFGVRIEMRPDDSTLIDAPKDRSSDGYVSEAWTDVPRVLDMLDRKLMRLRPTASMHDFVKFCRVLDAVRYDLDLSKGQQTTAMVEVLGKLRASMDASVSESLS
jgi:hypothetical protein